MIAYEEFPSPPPNPYLIVALAVVAGGGAWGLSMLVRRAWWTVRTFDTMEVLLAGRTLTEGEWIDGDTKLIAICNDDEWPSGCHVYAHYNSEGECVYAGQAKDLRGRFLDHGKSLRASEHDWQTWKAWTCTAEEMNRVERTLIHFLNPQGNVQKYGNWAKENLR